METKYMHFCINGFSKKKKRIYLSSVGNSACTLYLYLIAIYG